MLDVWKGSEYVSIQRQFDRFVVRGWLSQSYSLLTEFQANIFVYFRPFKGRVLLISCSYFK